jgi:hypothetical protein
MRLALLRMERYRHLGQQLAPLAREIASIFVLRYALPVVGRQAFAVLKPPLPRCAAESARTYVCDFRQKAATIRRTPDANSAAIPNR